MTGANYTYTGLRHNDVGDKRYEQTDHRSNVNVVVTDRKLPISDGFGNVDYYTADVVLAQDFYPFGMLMPNRHGSVDEYRYGFNNMEKDDEIKGKGNSYDFGARMYDPRVGRWLTQDAVSAKKPDLSPYQAFRNSPVIFSDPDGNDEYLSIIVKNQQTGTTTIIRGHEVISNNVRAGAIREAGNSPTIYESQNFYDFRTVITMTIDEQGGTSFDVTHYTLIDRKRYTKTFLSSILSGVTTGTIVDPNAPGFDWSLEGNGGSQNGGYTFVSDNGGASHTKQRALNPVEERNIEDLITYFGGGNRKATGTGTITDFVDRIKGMVEELNSGGSSSNEIKDNKGGNGGNAPKSNTIHWREPNKRYGSNTGQRFDANPKEKAVGDTVGGNPDKNLYPGDKGHRTN